MTTLLSEVKLIPVPPFTPVRVVPDKMGSDPDAMPIVNEFRLPLSLDLDL